MENNLNNQTQIFKTSIAGFNRGDVLKYIEKISADNAESLNQLNEQIAQLAGELSENKKALSDSNADKEILLTKTKEVCDELDREKQRTRQQDEQLEKLNNECATFKNRLFSKEQESISYKKISEGLQRQLNEANEKLSRLQKEYEEGQSSARQADVLLQTAQRTAKAAVYAAQNEIDAKKAELTENAQDIAVAVSALKKQINDIEKQIDETTRTIKLATKEIALSLGNAENTVKSVGVQIPRAGVNTPPPFITQQAAKAEPKRQKGIAEALLESLNKLLG